MLLADDSLQLNFAAAETRPAKRRKVVVKNSSWKARVKRQQVADAPTSQATVSAPVELVKEDPSAPLEQLSSRKLATVARRAVISSLFSSRPVLPDVEEQQSPREPAKASNAPSDGSFASTGLCKELVDLLTSTKMGLERPTPIQASALPLLLQPGQTHDIILQAQTGSGKTLAYLLPVIQDLLHLAARCAKLGKPLDRSVGTLAIILVPTRELANQIYETAQSLLAFKGADGSSPRWLTPGLLSGGMHRQHEKARLRKGLPLLIATPGRLIDHLTSTTSFRLAGEPLKKQRDKPENDFEVEDNPRVAAADDAESEDDLSKPTSRSYRPRFADKADPALALRWLVLDEADRLMDMGFEPQIQEILGNLTRRARPGQIKRRNVLCSATMQEKVEKLAGMALTSPRVLTAAAAAAAAEDDKRERPAPPAQLVQSYSIVPPKLRFVALVALLRRLFAGEKVKSAASGENKALVFVSCTAAVDLLWSALGGLQLGFGNADESDEDEEEEKVGLVQQSAVLPGANIFRLHGNLDVATRLAALKAFTNAPGRSVLICTSVAARGLDVPFVRSVIQYDLPTEGGVNEYIHRVGRTARAGRAGEAWAFLLPSEGSWVTWAEEKMNEVAAKTISLSNMGVDALLQSGFGGDDFETRATDVQMAFERWVEKGSEHSKLARNAFLSHVRAYATHPSDEKHIFHVKNLHLGHLAKSFGLRDAPSDIKVAGQTSKRPREAEPAEGKRVKQPRTGRGLEGKGLKPARVSDASEFAVSGIDELERMVARRR